MITARNFILSIFAGICLTSCMITDNIRTIQVEIMKPGVFTFPDQVDTVAIFKRDLYKSDTCKFGYYSLNRSVTDTTIHFKELSNHCVDALAKFIKNEGYFKKVNYYRDSLNYLWADNQKFSSIKELYKGIHSDFYIFLDYFSFNKIEISSTYDFFYAEARLFWTINFKTDTASYIYNQVDTLIYEGPEYNIDVTKNKGPELELMNASEYLGKYFGTKIIPSWVQVERMYYKSSNSEMLKAEKFALNNDWLKAAEIWKMETKNKNHRIGAKACYNMALACEMEGKSDAAIDWLVKSYNVYSKNETEHKANCQRYINILAIRKKEIEQLGKQIR